MANQTVTLRITPPAENGDTVTVSYTPGGNPVEDLAGNAAAALAAEAVTNNTPDPGSGSYDDADFVGEFTMTGFAATGNPRGFVNYGRLHDLSLQTEIVAKTNPSGFPNVAKAVVDEDSTTWYGGNDTSVNGDATFWGLNAANAYGVQGQTAVYRFWFLLPSGSHMDYPGTFTVPSAKAVGGKGTGWSTLMNWHENAGAGSSSAHIGVQPVGGRLRVRSVGGTLGGAVDFYEKMVGNPLPFDTWHDVISVCDWSTGTDGRMDVYLNGAHVFPTVDMPATWRTLWAKSGANGVYLQVGHYRASPMYYVGLGADYTDTVYVGPTIIGPDLASVGA